MSRFLGILLLCTMLLVLVPGVLYTSAIDEKVGFHMDFPHARVVVTYVVDGDTIRISPSVCVAGEYRTIVRLADIDAPPPDTPEGEEARGNLINLLSQYGYIIYLDIANYTRDTGCSSGLIDGYGRIIAVVYVRVNSTHILNVNKWMVENSYAQIEDFQNDDFDPNKWSLFIGYDLASEKLPDISKVTLYTGYIVNATAWGVRVAVTPDKNYMGISFSEGAPDYSAQVYILDNQGNLVKSHRITGSNTWRGMIDIAANDTGFLVVWTDAGINRTARFSYIPIVEDPTPPQTIQDAITYSYHPLVTYYHNGTIGYWVIIYGKQTTTWTRINTTWYFLNLSYHRNWWWGLAPGGNNESHRVGHDVISGIVHDPSTRKFILVARNVTTETGHDIIGITGEPNTTYGIYIRRFNIDDRPGDQGPEPDLTTYNYTFYNLFPSIYTKLLSSGRYVLVVYNESATSLAYAIIDLQPSTPSVTNGTLFNRDVPTTFYPWIASNASHWFVAWSGAGWVNASLITNSTPYLVRSFVIADTNGSFVRAAFDEWTEGSGKFIIPYAVSIYNATAGAIHRNAYLAFYNVSNDTLEPWILELGRNATPLHVVTLSTDDPQGRDRIAVVSLEGGDLVVYIVSETYPELQVPIPIPEPWMVAVAVATIATSVTLLLLFTRKRRLKYISYNFESPFR